MKSKKILFLSIIITTLSGCTDATVLQNKKTGETVKCGPYWTGLGADFEMDGIAARESQCIRDYKEQGFVRIPSQH